NPSEMDTVEDLRRKLYQLEQENLQLTHQRNQELFHYENEVRNLKLELERGEALRRGLESEISFARKEAHMQMYITEDQLYDVK
ncbi:CC171 protein, partial [Illadopsis cleaveri]|nr:CC171 protein [Illadopsis cleaveri]